MSQALRLLLEAAFLLCLLLLAPSARACSLAGCINDGFETRRDFVVALKHDGKPLSGVTIEIKTNQDAVLFTGITDPDGKAAITDLSPGQYWLSAQLLGIGAAYHCFHVAKRSSRKAKSTLKFSWGNLGPTMPLVTGKLVDKQPGIGGTPLWNLTHPVTVPIAGAALRLQNAISGAAFAATSDGDGSFAFDSVPDGTYVLHVENGTTGRPYDPTDLLIKVNASNTRDPGAKTAVVLSRQEGGAGSCGDTSLTPAWQ